MEADMGRYQKRPDVHWDEEMLKLYMANGWKFEFSLSAEYITTIDVPKR